MFHPKGPTFLELAQQALSSTETGYDLLAPKFDYTPFRTPELILNAVRPHIRDHSNREQSAVDVCCGTGAGMQMLLDSEFAKVTGIDFSSGMIEQAKKNLKVSDEKQKIEFLQANVLEPHFEEQFDLAVSFGAFGHILPKDEPAFIEAIARSLKPRGKFVFATTTRIPVWSPGYWLAKGFNFSMHIRNLIRKPRFIMFYLTFLWPDIKKHFQNAGMTCKAELLFPNQRRFRHVILVTAEKHDGQKKKL